MHVLVVIQPSGLQFSSELGSFLRHATHVEVAWVPTTNQAVAEKVQALHWHSWLRKFYDASKGAFKVLADFDTINPKPMTSGMSLGLVSWRLLKNHVQ